MISTFFFTFRTESYNMANRATRIKPGTEQFYGMSILFPADWVLGGSVDDIVVQWKGFGSAPHMMFTQKRKGLYLR